SLVPDSGSRGFFTFVAEPDPSESTSIINKVFTLIIDRSGSMGGNKIIQARNAASFIIEHLNEGDKFNIVDFASDVTCFSEEHVEYNTENESTALTYISNFYASGMTNISGAFSEAIPQFSTANDSTANIIIFFTDGEATTGITNTEGILNHVSNLVTQNETEVMIFTFGIGASVNEQLLSLLANQNNGIADFLGNDELEEKITEFYLKIQNPVLLNTNVTFTPSIIDEVYPLPLPNLYKGQQLIMVGRYQEAAPVNVNFSGDAFGQPVSYNYSPSLADSSVSQYQFLPKIWAKRKIEYLLIQYYAADPDSPEAEALEAQIIQISLDYGVISPFTEFSGGEVTAIETEDMENNNVVQKYELLGNFPNPFNPSTSIRFRINSQMNETVYIRIYNSMGQLVKVLSVNVNGQGEYSVLWNGKLENGSLAPSDIYFYVIEFDNAILSGKMVLVK
ncbi:MAG: VWA domain-containing protein, partial [Calditrichia bacterium]|nr:VWA domain-containing protein [Calditrichia bacterium]